MILCIHIYVCVYVCLYVQISFYFNFYLIFFRFFFCLSPSFSCSLAIFNFCSDSLDLFFIYLMEKDNKKEDDRSRGQMVCVNDDVDESIAGVVFSYYYFILSNFFIDLFFCFHTAKCCCNLFFHSCIAAATVAREMLVNTI